VCSSLQMHQESGCTNMDTLFIHESWHEPHKTRILVYFWTWIKTTQIVYFANTCKRTWMDRDRTHLCGLSSYENEKGLSSPKRQQPFINTYFACWEVRIDKCSTRIRLFSNKLVDFWGSLICTRVIIPSTKTIV